MPVTVVVGGQYGSEGKGKVAQQLAAGQHARAVVRVGGSNSGHTGVIEDRRVVLRQLPTAALLPDVLCVLGAGSYIDLSILLDEIDRVDLPPSRLIIDGNATMITADDLAAEESGGLVKQIGSTGSGTGAAVARRVNRRPPLLLAREVPALAPYVEDVPRRLREILGDDGRVLIEGTQGFGLSLLHSPHFPKTTSRDTTAASAVSEAGLSPLDVDQVVIVLRAFPIRVAGNSGSFGAEEISWETIAREGGHDQSLAEFTSVTRKLRRVARFDPEIVRQAIACNQPSMVVLNHVDYVDAGCTDRELTQKAVDFVASVGERIGRNIDLVGVGPDELRPFDRTTVLAD